MKKIKQGNEIEAQWLGGKEAVMFSTGSVKAAPIS